VPVNVLYCEGNSESIDVRIIRQLLPKDCTVRPIGGKNMVESSVIADRTIKPKPNLAGLLDRDFDCQDFVLSNTPQPLLNQNRILVGWTWERKEIENYLLDPQLVQGVLGRKAPPINEYCSVLEKSAQKIAVYTAARTALSCYRFKNFWGDEIKIGNLNYDFPKKLGKDACELKIKEIVDEYKGDRIVKTEDVLSKFKQLLPSFRPGGFRFENFLTFFAGKDLLYCLSDDLKRLEFDSNDHKNTPIDVFIERILKGIESDRVEEPWKLLAEWAALRKLIINTDFATWH